MPCLVACVLHVCCVCPACAACPSASPLDLAACEDEEKIVCNHGHIKGQQGVALDDMVYIMTRMARQMEEVGHMAWHMGHVGRTRHMGHMIGCALSQEHEHGRIVDVKRVAVVDTSAL